MTRPCDQLGPFLDQELSAAEAAAFRMHLAGCPDCPARLDAALQLAGLASEAASGPATAASAKAADPPARFRPRWARRAMTAASVAIAGALAVVFAPVPESVKDTVWLLAYYVIAGLLVLLVVMTLTVADWVATARYGAFLVDARRLFQAMDTMDSTSGRKRGLLVLH